MTNPHQHGYAFFANFLSDLGRTSTLSGDDNLASRLLFLIALIAGAVGITQLFAAFTQFFVAPGRARSCPMAQPSKCCLRVDRQPLFHWGGCRPAEHVWAPAQRVSVYGIRDMHACVSLAVPGRFVHAWFPTPICLCLYGLRWCCWSSDSRWWIIRTFVPLA